MQLPKHITKTLMMIILALGAGYIIVTQSHIVTSDETSINTGSLHLPLSQSDTGAETDTGKRLETLANSGTDWGMSPFGSGKPLEEEKKPEFKKPNTEWKTRTLSGINYVFGEGNPKEVGPLSEEEKEIYKKCYFNTVVYAMDCPSDSRGRGQGYITSDIEKDLIKLLNHPFWKPVLMNCEQQFRLSENSILDFEASYDRIIAGNYFNMEQLLVIDNRDGRKFLSGNFGSTLSWFGRALRENKEVLGTDVLRLNNCITQNGGLELYRLLDTIYQKQFYPDGNYPDHLTDPKKYIPAY